MRKLRGRAMSSRVRSLALEAIVGTHAGLWARLVLAAAIHPVRRAPGGRRHCFLVVVGICGPVLFASQLWISRGVEGHAGVKVKCLQLPALN